MNVQIYLSVQSLTRSCVCVFVEQVLCASYVDMHYGVADPNIVPDTDWK